MSRFRAPGNAKYRGDVSEEVVGHVVGPTTYRTYLTAVEASYDADTSVTTVFFAQSTIDDLTEAEPGFAEYLDGAA